jgi:Peptidase C39 family
MTVARYQYQSQQCATDLDLDSSMIHARKLFVTVFLILFCACFVNVAKGATQELDAKSGLESSTDIVCGPRCVKYILSQYGYDLELIDVIRAIQWPEIENGSGLGRIEKFLGEHGIYATSVHIEPQQMLDSSWQHPVILHLKGAENHTGLGHFVVWLPKTEKYGENIEIWNGLNGYQSGTRKALAATLSGYAIFTSPLPISDEDLTATISSQRTTRLIYIAVPLALLAAVFVYYRKTILGFIRAVANPQDLTTVCEL